MQRGRLISSGNQMSRGKEDYEGTSKLKEVNPADLRFTQPSVANRLRPSCGGFHLNQAVDEIRKGALSPSDICRSPLNVYSDGNGVMWCENNRRLWVLRKAGVSSVQVKLKSNGYNVRCHGKKRKMLKNPQFYPKLRHCETTFYSSGSGLKITEELRLLSCNGIGAKTLPVVDSQYTSENQMPVAALVAAFRTIIGCFAFAALITCFATWISSH